MKLLYSCFLTATLLVFAVNVPAANTETNFSIQIPTLDSAATIDGDLSDIQWQNAAVANLTYETSPGENIPARVNTQAKIFATDTSLFIAFIADDPHPEKIRANIADRDNVFGDDLVGIKLDTYHQAKLAYQFFVNPQGVQIDSVENELTGNESTDWDGIWHSKSKITEQGYQVEMELPLRLFNFNPQAEQTWGIEFVRFYPRETEQRLSTHKIDRNNSCQLCQLGTATGLRHIESSQDLQLTPSLVITRPSHREHKNDSQWDTENNIEPSLDIRWGITPSTLLSATINPDFSQVESDAGQLDINSTFALYFPEKRAFFLDNKDYFDSQLSLLHTRNIATPDYGLKLTSQVEAHTFAALIANDSNSQFLVPGNLSSNTASLDHESHNMAARYRFDLGNTFSIGSLITAKKSDEYHNYLFSSDIKYQPTEQDTFTAQYAVSDTLYPDDLFKSFCNSSDCSPTQGCTTDDCGINERVLRTFKQSSFTDHMYRIKYQHSTRNWWGFAIHESIGEDFRADLGFIEKVDASKSVLGGGYKWYIDDHFFNQASIEGDWDISHNQAGEKIEQEAEAKFVIKGDYQSYTELGFVKRERVGRRHDNASLAITGNTQMFDESFGWIFTNFKPTRTLELELEVIYGDRIDFSNDQLGTQLTVKPEIEWKVTPSISADLSHIYQTLDIDDGRLFTANLTDLRLSWFLDVHNFIRFTSVYTHIERDPNLYVNSQPHRLQKHLTNEVLYGYKLNPQSVFYLGYSDGLKANDDIDTLMRTEQTYFMKLSYAWLL